MASRAPSADAGGQVQEAAKTRAAAARGLGRQRVIGKARQEFRERNARLEPRQVHSGARVDAEAERDVLDWARA